MAAWERRVVKSIEYRLPVGCWAGDLDDALAAAKLDWQVCNRRDGNDLWPADYARVSVSSDGKQFIIRVTVPETWRESVEA